MPPCSTWSQDADEERPRPAYLPARISGYDARQVPCPDDDEQQEEPAEEQPQELARARVEQPDELADEDELDESAVELHLNEPPEEDEPVVPAGEKQPGRPTEGNEPGGPAEKSSQGGIVEASPHPVHAEEEPSDSEGEWAAPSYDQDVASGDEHEEEPYYEYAAPYVDPFAGFRDLRGGNIRR